MGMLDFLRWRSTPMPHPIERRDALGQMPVQYQVGKPQYPDRDPAVYDRDAYRKLALIFRCINVMANAVASAPVRVYQEAEQQPKELPNHRLRRLMTRPNPYMGEARFMAFVTMTLATSGYCVIEKVRSGAGIPVQLWPLRSDWLYPIRRSNAAPDWEYRIPGFDRNAGTWDGPISMNGYPIIPAKDCIALSYADTPDLSPTGIGPLEVALREWGLLNTMSDFVKAYFDNGVMPRWGLELQKDLGKGDTARAAAELIRDMFAGRFMGMKGRDPRDIPIFESAKPVRLDDNLNDMALVALRDVSEIAICTAFGVPGSMVGQRFAQERNTFTNYGEARQSFYEDTIVPLWARIDDALTLGLLADIESDATVFLQFDTSGVPALQEDENAKWERTDRALLSSRITVNEARIAVGYPPISGGDVRLVSFNMIEVPAGGSSPVRATQRVTAASVREVEPPALPSGEDDGDPITDGLVRLADRVDELNRRSRGLVPLEIRERIQTRAVNRYGATAKAFSPKIMLFFRAQGRRVVSQLNERAAVPGLETRDIADLIDDAFWVNEDAELDQVLRQLWNAMGEQATGDVSGLLNLGSDTLSWDIANPWVQEVQSLLGQRVTNINATTRDDIARIVTQSLDEGVSIPDLADRLRGQFEEVYRGRSETIARTESQVSYNEASAAGYAEGGVTEIELLDNPNHTDDPGSDGWTCAQRNGQIVPVGNASIHISAEHPRGTLAISPVIRLGEV